MEVKAVAKDTGVSARKLRLLIELVKNKPVAEALAILSLAPSPSAKLLIKTIKSAAANADNNFQMTPDALKITKIYADEAPTAKRFQPRARGRGDRILKRSSHITVIVAEQEA
ncbi:MAG: 50S ribosomal protein L22 [Dehalococcoidia bacterium]|nr:50S ribosomal protein L22 [Dehalococcoidia bacterium]